MSLIKCPECGKDISDKATVCIYCGFPIPEPVIKPICQYCGLESNNIDGYCEHCGMKISNSASTVSHSPDSLQNGSAPSHINTPPCHNKKPFYKKWWFIVIVILFIISIFRNTANKYIQKAKSNSVVDSAITVNTTSAETDTPTADIVAGKDDYIAACTTYDYKTLCRTPDEYKGSHITITVEIKQIIEQGLFSNNSIYYRCDGPSSYGLYTGDEYIFTDSRVDDTTKLLKSDVVTLYGEFTGVKEMTRSITNEKVEVPIIDVKYIDIIQ